MRLAGYDRDGEEISEADVLSDDEIAEDYARLRQTRVSGRYGRTPKVTTQVDVDRDDQRDWSSPEREQER